MKRLLAALSKLAGAIASEPTMPEHEIKRELERWFRGHGFSRSQSSAAVAGAFRALKAKGSE